LESAILVIETTIKVVHSIENFFRMDPTALGQKIFLLIEGFFF